MANNIYNRAKQKGVQFECTCVGIGMTKWERLMKNHTRANRREVIKIALEAGVIDEDQAKTELKNPWWNPYTHFKTATHIIYVYSDIEHFIRVN